MPPAVCRLMAHVTTIPALSLSRAVCGSITTAAVISGAVLIASTARKALSYWSGFVLGGSPCHSGREAGSGRAGFMRPRQQGRHGVSSGQARGEIRLGSHPPGGGVTDLSNAASAAWEGCWWGRARSHCCRRTRSSTARGAPRRRSRHPPR